MVLIISKIKHCMLPLLFLGFSGIYLPLGGNLAAYQLVDWGFLAAIQLLKLSTGPVLPCSAIWSGNVFSVSFMTCMCQHVYALWYFMHQQQEVPMVLWI